jgi:dimethylhistidine N-methyltransferase
MTRRKEPPAEAQDASALEQADAKVAAALGEHHDHPLIAAVGKASEIADQPPLLALTAATALAGLVLRRPTLLRAGLRMLASEIVATLGGPVWLLELGSGDGQKTRLVIEALLARQGKLEYVPVDISESAVEASSRSLLFSYPDLRITGYIGEYQTALRKIREDRRAPGLTLVLFLGSTLGNLDPQERRVLLRDIRALLDPGEGFLLGVDLKKPESVLVPAYDDALGVTAAFNLNLLVRVNRELGGEFDLGGFRHKAVYNPREGRVEMHLESRRAQTVAIRELGIEVPFAEGETIHTESSYKFDREQIAALAADTGFEVRKTWTDSEERFASNLLVAK